MPHIPTTAYAAHVCSPAMTLAPCVKPQGITTAELMLTKTPHLMQRTQKCLDAIKHLTDKTVTVQELFDKPRGGVQKYLTQHIVDCRR